MLLLLSPAKSLDFETPATTQCFSQPEFLVHSQQLVAQLRTLSPADLAALMRISDGLAVLNFNRFAEWSEPFDLANAKQAILAFNGDVYEGLDAGTLGQEHLVFAQDHVRILSGLYGLLRPLDLIQPYRLEMGTRLVNARGKDLYGFWGSVLTDAINTALGQSSVPVVINLASEEYFKAVQSRKHQGRVIQPVFEDWKDGRYRVISFHAKRARGLMTRFCVENQIETPEPLQDFSAEGYAFAPACSDEDRWVFRRHKL